MDILIQVSWRVTSYSRTKTNEIFRGVRWFALSFFFLFFWYKWKQNQNLFWAKQNIHPESIVFG